jgi:hypothetical protein
VTNFAQMTHDSCNIRDEQRGFGFLVHEEVGRLVKFTVHLIPFYFFEEKRGDHLSPSISKQKTKKKER